MLYVYDTIIIGAGPAGLAAGFMLKRFGLTYLILEKGKNIINRDVTDAHDISSGVGGCGLFSDGKLSFPPSASCFWTGLKKENLKRAYKDFRDLCMIQEIKLPVWQDSWTESITREQGGRKKYPSILMNNFARNKLLNYLYSCSSENIRCCSEVNGLEKVGTYYEIKLLDGQCYYAKEILIATGRFGNQLLKQIEPGPESAWIKKYELGIRIETPERYFKPGKENLPDYKIIEREYSIEFRTFCSCKNGTVVRTEFDQYVSFNGAQTQFPTKRSNIGLLLRCEGDETEYSVDIHRFLNSQKKAFVVSLEEFLINKQAVYISSQIDQFLRSKIDKVIDISNGIPEDSLVYGPEIEYVGDYIQITNRTLKLKNNVYIAGDVSGTYRGLTAALVAGIYCARDIALQKRHFVASSISHLGIKVSSIENMRTVFTAQSKNFFYCKDAICEFVLKNNMLPINPFMVFGYFLNDRVDRDLIRRGNNQLIQMCDELWVFGPIADGVLFEISLAKQLRKRVRFYKIGTRISEIKEIDICDENEIVFEPEVHSRQIKKSDLMAFIRDESIIDGQMSMFEFYTGDDGYGQ